MTLYAQPIGFGCSSLTCLFFREAPDEDWAQKPLRELEAQAAKLLEASLELGRVVIVTNAVEPWVETSCRNFLPALLPVVEKIDVVYARSVYESCGVDESQQKSSCCLEKNGSAHVMLDHSNVVMTQLWKEIAFHQTLHNLYSEYEQQSWKNILCIGDSPCEHQAIRVVTSQRPHKTKRCYTKTMKLLHEPSIQELISQVKMVQVALTKMVEHDGHLNIELSLDDLEIAPGELHADTVMAEDDLQKHLCEQKGVTEHVRADDCRKSETNFDRFSVVNFFKLLGAICS